MTKEIIVHLVIVGKNPLNNEFSIGLISKDNKHYTISGVPIEEPDVQACSFSTKFINAPLEWYEVRKQTFISNNDNIHLIYTATVPNNIKLKGGAEWYSIQSLHNLDEIEKDIILEGIKL